MKGKLIYYDHGNYSIVLTHDGKIGIGYDGNARMDKVMVYNQSEVAEKRYIKMRDFKKSEVKNEIKISFDNPDQIAKNVKDKIYSLLTDIVNNGYKFVYDHILNIEIDV
jgi:hypothetical protein